jgi:Concanavalin A-like lectin/glucanases superfamily
VRIADSPSLDFRVVTIMGWVRVDVLGADPRSLIFDRNNGLALFVRNTTGSAGIGVRTTSTSGGPNDPAAFPLGTWTHLAGTYDGTLITLYVGGALVASLPMTGDITSDDLAGSRIGGNLPDTTNNAEEVLQGQIDELGVWNEALPASRIIAAAAQ